MKQAIIEAIEIKKLEEVIRVTPYKKQKRQLIKSANRRRNELKEYCGYKEINYSEIFREGDKRFKEMLLNGIWNTSMFQKEN